MAHYIHILHQDSTGMNHKPVNMLQSHRLSFYHPQMKLREGNVFTNICVFTVHGCLSTMLWDRQTNLSSIGIHSQKADPLLADTPYRQTWLTKLTATDPVFFNQFLTEKY